MAEIDKDKITELGNPAKPQDTECKIMLSRMNIRNKNFLTSYRCYCNHAGDKSSLMIYLYN